MIAKFTKEVLYLNLWIMEASMLLVLKHVIPCGESPQTQGTFYIRIHGFILSNCLKMSS